MRRVDEHAGGEYRAWMTDDQEIQDKFFAGVPDHDVVRIVAPQDRVGCGQLGIETLGLDGASLCEVRRRLGQGAEVLAVTVNVVPLPDTVVEAQLSFA